MPKKKSGHGNGAGSLERRGGVYLARWMVDGRRFTKSTGTGDRREAEKRLAEFVTPFKAKDDAERLQNLAVKIEGRKAEIRRYEDSLPALKVADAFDAYRALPKKHTHGRRKATSEDTLRMYESQYNRFARWVAANYPDAEELRNVSEDMAAEFLSSISGLSANSYNKYITLFAHLWDALRKVGRLDANPWRDADMMEEAESLRRPLTVEEVARVVAPLTGEMRVLFALGIFTGLRLGDCALMDWGQIDLVRGFITVRPRKTRKTRTLVCIPIRRELHALLEEIPAEYRTGYLLPDTAKMYLRNSSLVTTRTSAAFAAAGIKTQERIDGKRARVVVGFHSLRHTFVSLAANAGVPLAVVQSLVGHGNPMMTAHYFHESEAATQKAIEALPAIGAESIPGASESKPVAQGVEVSADIYGRLEAIARAHGFEGVEDFARNFDATKQTKTRKDKRQ